MSLCPPPPHLLLDDEAGIIEHVARDLFGCLEEKISNDEAKVTLTYLELYMEEVRDLLILPTHQKCLALRDDAEGNTGKSLIAVTLQ